MGVFKKASKYRKPLSELKIKEDFLNQELKKTGILSEKMSTSKMYYDVASHTPAVEAILSDVPDPNNIRVNGSGNASDIDPSDPSTWANGGNSINHLLNTNTLPVTNGDDVSNQPVLPTPDVTGFAGLDTDQPYAGIFGGSYWGVWGASYGVIGAGNKATIILPAFGWPNGSAPGEGDRTGFSGQFRADSDATYNARMRMKEQVLSYYPAWHDNNNWKTVKAWVDFNSYGFGKTWTAYKAQSGTIWREGDDGGGGALLEAYVSLGVYVGHSNNYTSTVATPKSIILRANEGLGDPGFFPGPIQSWLMNKLKLAKQGAEYLLDKVKSGVDNFIDDTRDDLDKRWNRLNNLVDKFVDDVGRDADAVRDVWNGVQDGRHLLSNVMATIKGAEMSNSIDENGNIKSEAQGSPQNPLKNEVRDSTAKDIIQGIDWSQNPPVAYDQFGKPRPIGQQIQDNVSAAPWEDGGNIGAKGTHNNLPNYGDGTSNTPAPYVNEDGDLIIPDTFHFGPGGHEKKWLPRATRAAIDTINKVAAGHDGNTKYQGGNLISDEQKKEADEEARTIMDQSLGIFIPNIPGRKDPVVHFQTVISAEQLKRVKGKQKTNESYLSEGWQSPEHVNVDKDERKRWFKEKDIQPEYPKKAPPKQVNGWHPSLVDKPIDNPTIKITDEELIRNHRLTDKEVKEWTDTINALNAYIDANPAELIHARQRYPVSDPRLAELNWKMDTMLGATEEFLDKKYPENTRLFNQLQKSVTRSIKLTDPTTFKVKIGKETSYKKLLNVDYITHAYSPTAQKEIKVKVKQDKDKNKTAARFFRKERKKSKSEILDLRIKQLDIDMSKTLTNT